MVDKVPPTPRLTGDTTKDLTALNDWIAAFVMLQNTANQSAADRVPTTEEVANAGGFLASNVLDEDDFASDSDEKVPTQQSAKAYVGNRVVTCIAVAASDEITAITAGTGKTTFHMPYAFELTDEDGVAILPFAGLTTAQASGNIFTVDINKNGASIFSTVLTIDNTEETSITAATPAVLASTPVTFAKGDKVTIDVDQIGNGSAKGLKVYLIGRKLAA